MKLLQEIMPIALLVITCLYCQVVIKRDKQFRKAQRKTQLSIDRKLREEERKRKLEEEINMLCICHPDVISLDQARFLSKQISKKIG